MINKKEKEKYKSKEYIFNSEENANYKKNVWKPFFKLIITTRLPYIMLIITFVLYMNLAKLSLLLPQYTQYITSGDFSKHTFMMFLLCSIGGSVINLLAQLISGVTNSLVTKSFRIKLIKEVNRLPLEVIEKEGPKNLISRMTTDTASLSALIASSIPAFFSALYLLIGSCKKLFNYDLTLVGIMITYTVVRYGLTVFQGRVSYRRNSKATAQVAKITNYFSEVLINIPLVKIFANEKKEEERGKQTIRSLYKLNMKNLKISTAILSLFRTVDLGFNLLIIFIGMLSISKGTMTLSTWLAFTMYNSNVKSSVQEVIARFGQVKITQGKVRKLSEIVDMKKEDFKTGVHMQQFNKDIIFENVDFSYGEKKVLNNISFTVPNGKVTALVGESGSGKSTIFSLIERFYKPQSGNIKYGDSVVEAFNVSSWRDSFALVSQDMKLFSGSVYQNLVYGLKREVSKEEVEDACRAADAYDFIMGFDNGFESEVGEFGSKLSGGQRQRIAIAKAILRDSKYLLLDEATSNLDVESQAKVQVALNNLIKGKTTLIIAHRLNTIRNADQIIVVKEGRIVGSGTHEELLNTNETYVEMVQAQSFV